MECINYLTPAINNPKVVASAKSLVTDHLYSVIDGDNMVRWASNENALCFGKALSRSAAFIWFGAAFLISITATCIVGSAVKDVGIGLAIGSLLLAVCVSIQCLLLNQQVSISV